VAARQRALRVSLPLRGAPCEAAAAPETLPLLGASAAATAGCEP
jgi:hypothetical protein